MIDILVKGLDTRPRTWVIWTTIAPTNSSTFPLLRKSVLPLLVPRCRRRHWGYRHGGSSSDSDDDDK